MNMNTCKCAWCEHSQPTAEGGWKCGRYSCGMSRSDMERILRLIGGAK